MGKGRWFKRFFKKLSENKFLRYIAKAYARRKIIKEIQRKYPQVKVTYRDLDDTYEVAYKDSNGFMHYASGSAKTIFKLAIDMAIAQGFHFKRG